MAIPTNTSTTHRAVSTARRWPCPRSVLLLVCIIMIVFLSICWVNLFPGRTVMHLWGFQHHHHQIQASPRPVVSSKVELQASMWRGDFYKNTMEYTKPLNILVVGGAGAGKSSFVNSAIRAITGKTGRWCTIGQGKFRGKITAGLHRYNLYFPDLGNDRVKQESTFRAPDGGPITIKEAPHMIDLAGLPDENNPLVRMVLKLILYGHFKTDEDNILDAMKDTNPRNPLNLLDDHPKANKDLAIHRVIVVANADGDVPWELLKAVMDTAQPLSDYGDGVVSKRAVPVFGLMTKLDLVEKPDGSLPDKVIQRKQDLIELLCLKGAADKFGMCKNYVSVEGEEMVNDPEKDKNILKFMCNVIDPHQRIVNDQWKLQKDDFFRKPKEMWRSLNAPLQLALACGIVSILFILCAAFGR